jgi:FMN phosphatase YigB (HAD superfamily)
MFTSQNKIILLDIGNVIVDVDFGAFCTTVAAKPDDEQAVFEKFCVGDFKGRFDRGDVSITSFFQSVADDSLVRTISTQDVKEAWQNIFTLKEGAREGIARLKRDHRVWVMSDTDPLHFTVLLNRFPVLRAMDRFYLSFEHGFLKSSPEAFVHVIESSGIEPGDFLLIDDKPDNCFSCKSVGVDSILFTSWSDLPGKRFFSG